MMCKHKEHTDLVSSQEQDETECRSTYDTDKSPTRSDKNISELYGSVTEWDPSLNETPSFLVYVDQLFPGNTFWMLLEQICWDGRSCKSAEMWSTSWSLRAPNSHQWCKANSRRVACACCPVVECNMMSCDDRDYGQTIVQRYQAKFSASLSFCHCRN